MVVNEISMWIVDRVIYTVIYHAHRVCPPPVQLTLVHGIELILSVI